MRASSISLVAFGAVVAAQIQVRGVVPSSEELTATTSTTRTNTVTNTRTITCSNGGTACQTDVNPVVPSTTVTTSSTVTESADVLPVTEPSSCSTAVTVTVGSSSTSTVTVKATTTATTSIVISTLTSAASSPSTFTPEPVAPSSGSAAPSSSSAAPSSSTDVSPEFTSKSTAYFVYPPYGSGNSTINYGTGTGVPTSLVSQTPSAVTPKPSSTLGSGVLSNKSSKMTAPGNGLALTVTALMMVFMSLGDNLTLVSFTFLFLDCIYTRSMGCSAFTITYFAVGGAAFFLGETSLRQFLDMSV